jgi:hypothetical protein
MHKIFSFLKGFFNSKSNGYGYSVGYDFGNGYGYGDSCGSGFGSGFGYGDTDGNNCEAWYFYDSDIYDKCYRRGDGKNNSNDLLTREANA